MDKLLQLRFQKLSVKINMSDHTHSSNFRYSNDNRSLTPKDHNYPSQNQIPDDLKKGEIGYYPNDNVGSFPNSNRPNTSHVDEKNKEQPPNSNYRIP